MGPAGNSQRGTQPNIIKSDRNCAVEAGPSEGIRHVSRSPRRHVVEFKNTELNQADAMRPGRNDQNDLLAKQGTTGHTLLLTGDFQRLRDHIH